MKIVLMGCKCPVGVYSAWMENGYKVIRSCEGLCGDSYENICKTLDYQTREQKIDYIFTFSFFPDLAKATHERNIIYISWIWDSPHSQLWAKDARYETNRIFVFDRLLCTELRQRGMDNVWHLPLAADAGWYDEIINSDDNKSFKQYASDVTFLGNFYNDSKHDLYSQIAYLPPYVMGYMDALLAAQKSLWGADLLKEGITEDVWQEISKYVKWDLNDRYEDDYYRVIFRNIIGQRITKTERMEMCSLLNKRYNFSLYTDCDTSFDKDIISKGHADYLTQMPLIFRYSKINIHITLRSITSGIALRIMDVLACKGFLLTNYQPEICEYFEDGKDLVIYSDFDDMCEKIDYYLKHDEERNRIAESGYTKVKSSFSYFEQIKKIVKNLEKN